MAETGRSVNAETHVADEVLVARYLAGDAAAFDVLYHRWRSRVIGVAYRWCGRRDVAEDLAQETWLRVFRRLETFDTSARFGTWIHTIARNITFDWLRSVRRRVCAPGHVVSLEALLDVEPGTALGHLSAVLIRLMGQRTATPYDLACATEARARVAAAVAQLPRLEREAIELHVYREETTRAISAALGIPRSTIVTRYHQALRHLAEALLRPVAPVAAATRPVVKPAALPVLQAVHVDTRRAKTAQSRSRGQWHGPSAPLFASIDERLAALIPQGWPDGSTWNGREVVRISGSWMVRRVVGGVR